MAERLKVSAEAVMSTLREVVAERPDYVYEVQDVNGTRSCLYVHSDEGGTKTPGCLVGHVLNRLGVPLETLSEREGSDAEDVAIATLDIVSEDSGEDVRHVLWRAQGKQDAGETWQSSLDYALHTLGE